MVKGGVAGAGSGVCSAQRDSPCVGPLVQHLWVQAGSVHRDGFVKVLQDPHRCFSGTRLRGGGGGGGDF